MEQSHYKHWKRKKPFIFLFIIAGIFALSAVVMFLWNAILPDVIDVNPLNYWQALGILVLSKILFGGSKFGPGRKHYKNKHLHFKEKFMNMTDEQKESFREEWRYRCGKKKTD